MAYEGGYPRATAVQVVRGRYDFAVDGGAVGEHTLTSGKPIPKNAVILGGFVEVDAALTSSASGGMQVKVQGADDIVDGGVVANAPWSTTGRKSVIPVFTGATTVKTSESRDIVGVVETGALSGGSFDVVLFYVELPD